MPAVDAGFVRESTAVNSIQIGSICTDLAEHHTILTRCFDVEAQTPGTGQVCHDYGFIGVTTRIVIDIRMQLLHAETWVLQTILTSCPTKEYIRWVTLSLYVKLSTSYALRLAIFIGRKREPGSPRTGRAISRGLPVREALI